MKGWSKLLFLIYNELLLYEMEAPEVSKAQTPILLKDSSVHFQQLPKSWISRKETYKRN